MQLKIFGSSSAGNSYLFSSDNGDRLLIDCGVHFDAIKKGLGFKVSGQSVLITHSHQDHCKSAHDCLKYGMEVYTSEETAKECGFEGHYRFHPVKQGKAFKIGSFKCLAFEVKHDVKCYGYLIEHPECGRVVFITDTYYVPYTFPELNQIIVEANYDRSILDEKLKSDKRFLRDRVLSSHMELQTTIDFLLANDLSQVHHIVLIHLSDGNSHALNFQKKVERLTQKKVTIGDAGVVMELNKEAF